jgi:hypothetical protein
MSRWLPPVGLEESFLRTVWSKFYALRTLHPSLAATFEMRNYQDQRAPTQ